MSVIPLPAATTVLVRDGAGGLEVYLLKRHRASGFMANAFVFPGGKVDPGDGTAEIAALRELFEEAGVLLVDETVDADRRAALRQRLHTDKPAFPDLLAQAGLTPATDRLAWWAHWITPSVEPRRFDTTFFLAALPADQTPTIDQKEAVAELWVTPEAGLAQHAAGAIRLPPPQRRTLAELAPHQSVAALQAESQRRRCHAHPICPRITAVDGAITILLPWDPDYLATPGEGEALPPDHPLAIGETRYVLA